jgi:hypothetical protein
MEKKLPEISPNINPKMNDKIGIVVGIFSGIIYLISKGGFNYFQRDFITASLMAISSLMGILLIPAVIALIISLINKKSNFGNVFGYTCLISYALLYFGNN